MSFLIRRSPDRSLFAAPRGLSQLVTSFIGSWCQGIRPVLFFAWTSYYSLVLWIAWVSFKQDFLSHWKGFSFSCRFPPFGEIVSHLWCVYPFWKDSINFSILSSLICSFLSTHFNPNIWIFRLPIRLSSFMCPCVRFSIASPSRDVWRIWLNVTRACRPLCGLVGLDGLEPSTSRLSGARSSHLSYKPEFNS